MAFTTVRSATGVDFIGTPGVDIGIIFDETGKVTLSGLGDADLIQINNSANIQRTATINGGDGADQITFNFGTSISDSSINGNKGADTINLAGSVSNSFVGGGEGSDIIRGGQQLLASKIEGGAGSDTIQVAINLALATVNGGDGNDTITLFNGPNQIFNNVSINGNAGADRIDGTFLNVTLSGSNFIGGGADDDTIDFSNATTDNNPLLFAKGFDLTGGSGNDVINGSTDNDTIWGNADNDTITGGTGTDTVFAGAGNDRINALNDRITGGLGADAFWNFGGTSTFFVNTIAESAAATSGTARTFDSFANYAFAAGDVLNISALTNQLAGGQYAGGASSIGAGVLPIPGVAGAYADFGLLQAALNGLNATASTVGGIAAYAFTTNIGGAGAANYVWIQDSQSAYTSSDLLFQTAAGGFGANGIVLV